MTSTAPSTTPTHRPVEQSALLIIGCELVTIAAILGMAFSSGQNDFVRFYLTTHADQIIAAGATVVGSWRKASWAPIAAVVTAALVGLPVATLVIRFAQGPAFSGWLLATQAAQICALVMALRTLVRRATA